MLPERHVPVLAEDDVIGNLDLEQLTSAHQITRNFDVRLTRRRVPTRMLVLCDAPVYVQCPIDGPGISPTLRREGMTWICLSHPRQTLPARRFAR